MNSVWIVLKDYYSPSLEIHGNINLYFTTFYLGLSSSSSSGSSFSSCSSSSFIYLSNTLDGLTNKSNLYSSLHSTYLFLNNESLSLLSLLSVVVSLNVMAPVPIPFDIVYIILLYLFFLFWSTANIYFWSGNTSSTFLTKHAKSLVWIIGILLLPSPKILNWDGLYNQLYLKYW